jgi:hypothetical protein
VTSKRRRIDSFGSRSSKNWKAASRQRSGVCLPEVSLSHVSRDMLWARIPAPGGFNGSDTIDMLLRNSKTGGFESMTSKDAPGGAPRAT